MDHQVIHRMIQSGRDRDLYVAIALAALAQAEALERIAAAIEASQHGDHAVPIRTVVVPS